MEWSLYYYNTSLDFLIYFSLVWPNFYQPSSVTSWHTDKNILFTLLISYYSVFYDNSVFFIGRVISFKFKYIFLWYIYSLVLVENCNIYTTLIHSVVGVGVSQTVVFVEYFLWYISYCNIAISIYLVYLSLLYPYFDCDSSVSGLQTYKNYLDCLSWILL